MSEIANTPEEIADLARRTIGEALESAKLNAVGVTTCTLVEDGQPLAAWHFLRGSGVSEGSALAVLDSLGAGGKVLDLLHLPELSTCPDE